MAPNSLIPKIRVLTQNETQSSFDSWRDGIVWQISLDKMSARFLDANDLGSWDNSVNRGFKNDTAAIAEDIRMTAPAKEILLKNVLGCVCANAPIISSNFIKNVATSLDAIWDRLRSYYGFRKTGGRITEFFEFKTEPGESREALWERMYTFLEDNLLSSSGSVMHEGKAPEEMGDEEFSPTLLCVLVVNWLHTINPSLPAMVRQKFPTQLRSNTIYSIRDEISDAIPALLEEIDEKANINRMRRYVGNREKSKFKSSRPKRICCLCEAAGRFAEGHYLSKCPYLPEKDRSFITKTRDIYIESESDSEEEQKSDQASSRVIKSPVSTNRRVDIIPSPVIEVSTGPMKSHMLLDLGAEANLIEETHCRNIGATILPTHQRAVMADGKTAMRTIGETNFPIKFGHHTFSFNGLVVSNLDSNIIAGVPFLEKHDIYVRPSTRTAYISDCCQYKYFGANPIKVKTNLYNPSILRVSSQSCVLPGESVSFPIPENLFNENEVAVEPRVMCTPANTPNWLQSSIIPVKDGTISITNTTNDPVLLKRHAQILQVRPVTEAKTIPGPNPDLNITQSPSKDTNLITIESSLKQSDKNKFIETHEKYSKVFSSGIGLYNGNSGDYKHTINMSNALPLQRKGRVPMYNRHDLNALQLKCDELLSQGVLCRPEDANILVTHCNPSFLVKKSSGGSRLVTSFGPVAEYALVPPTITTDVEDVLRQVGQWRYLIKTDLKSAYYQIPLDRDSMKYVGINTPYKGTYVYQRSVMGLPGSEAALEEVLSRILGDLLQSGNVVKLVDDLYVGSSTISELLNTWNSVLCKLQHNGMKLSPEKTFICPTSTIILGWRWTNGSIAPTSHRLSALAACEPPSTVKGLRSFIGCYKYMSRSLPFYADILDPLEKACAGRKSPDKIIWSDSLTESFNNAKSHLKQAKPVTLPRYNDQLHIVTDAAVRCAGIASALYVIRGDKPVLAGHFNAKLRGHQNNWLPCEVEALSIGASVKHFAPYIVQSDHRTRVMTDSKPCVQAYKRLLRGEFSNSPRLSTFLSLLSRYNIEVLHIPGSDNTFVDFASRHPIQCNGSCQVCTFISNLEECVIGQLQVNDVLSGKSNIPYSSRKSWLDIQNSCPDITKTKEYLREGINPSRKKGKSDIFRYLNCASIANDGMLIVKRSDPFQKSVERIVIPRKIAPGLVTALHLELSHPSTYQLEQVFSRAFFTLDMHSTISKVGNNCHTCASLKSMPSLFKKQSTSPTIHTVGSNMSADILKDYGQMILILRENISAYTVATFVPDEKGSSLRDGLIMLTSQLRSSMSPEAIIRTDPASGFRSLLNDPVLTSHKIIIELGEAKNLNKNPIAEKAIEELREELLKIQPNGGKISMVTLACALTNLNSRIRSNKLSSFEVWTQREMSTGNQISVNDKSLIDMKIKDRMKNHKSSEKFKARGKQSEVRSNLSKGDIVYLYIDRDKSKARDKYLVVDVEKDFVIIQKFVGHQLRKRKYRVRKSDCITINTGKFMEKRVSSDSDHSEEDELFSQESLNHQNRWSPIPKRSGTSLPNTENPGSQVSTPPTNQSPNMQNRYPSRNRKPPTRYKDFVIESCQESSGEDETDIDDYSPSSFKKKKKKKEVAS